MNVTAKIALANTSHRVIETLIIPTTFHPSTGKPGVTVSLRVGNDRAGSEKAGKALFHSAFAILRARGG
ncbi:MAG: hypothetical protein WAL47_03005 [Pyrinomonadaceae bacterium]